MAKAKAKKTKKTAAAKKTGTQDEKGIIDIFQGEVKRWPDLLKDAKAKGLRGLVGVLADAERWASHHQLLVITHAIQEAIFEESLKDWQDGYDDGYRPIPRRWNGNTLGFA